MKRKIVQIVRSPIGGIRKHILSIVDGLGDDFEMFLILDEANADKSYFDWISKSNKAVKIYNVRVEDNPGLRDILNLYKILQIIKDISPDVIHGHGAKGGLYARLIGFYFGLKVIYTAHGGAVHDMHGSFKNKIYGFIEKVLYYFTDLLVFESRYTMTQYSKKINLHSAKFRLNYNSIDTNKLAKPLNCKAIDSSKEIILGAFGLLRHIKGHDLLIPALANLREKGFPVSLKIFGTGEEKESLLKMARDAKVEQYVFVIENIESVDEEMKQCHIIVHPSRFESFGYVPLEAAVNGVSVVSSLEGGLNEVMNSGKNGFCTKILSAQSIEEQIELAIKNETLREMKFQSFLKYIGIYFSSDTFLRNLRGYYCE